MDNEFKSSEEIIDEHFNNNEASVIEETEIICEAPEEVGVISDETIKTARHTFSMTGISLSMLLFIENVIMILCAAVLQAFGLVDQWYMIAILVVQYVISYPIFLLVYRKQPRTKLESGKLGAARFWKLLIVCFPILMVGNLVGTLLSNLLSGGRAANAVEDMVLNGGYLEIIIAVIIAPIFEEIIFRKMILDRTARYGEVAAILFSAICFGLFHTNLFQFFYAFGIGLVFAYVYVRTGRIRYSIIMHMIINFFGSALPMMFYTAIEKTGLAEFEGDALQLFAENPEAVGAFAGYGLYLIAYVGLAIAGAVILAINVGKLHFEPAEDELPKRKVFRVEYVNVGVILLFALCVGLMIVNLLPM